MSVGVQRYFAAVRIYTPTSRYHLNFDRLLAAVEILNEDGVAGRLTEKFRERFPELSPKEIHDYFCAAQAVVSNNIDLSEVAS